MKRLLCLAISVLMLLSFSACGSNDEAANSTVKSTVSENGTEQATAVNENSTEQATNKEHLTTGENAATSPDSTNANVSGKSNNSTTKKVAQQNKKCPLQFGGSIRRIVQFSLELFTCPRYSSRQSPSRVISSAAVCPTKRKCHGS